jgi:hypothetical protein
MSLTRASSRSLFAHPQLLILTSSSNQAAQPLEYMSPWTIRQLLRLFVGEGVDGIFLGGLPCGVKCSEQ